jgi:hypothetical protein
MGDGYFSEGRTILCTDNFTKEEILNLIDVLSSNFDINATPKKRINPDGSIK